jgi:hypothetical protein
MCHGLFTYSRFLKKNVQVRGDKRHFLKKGKQLKLLFQYAKPFHGSTRLRKRFFPSVFDYAVYVLLAVVLTASKKPHF